MTLSSKRPQARRPESPLLVGSTGWLPVAQHTHAGEVPATRPLRAVRTGFAPTRTVGGPQDSPLPAGNAFLFPLVASISAACDPDADRCWTLIPLLLSLREDSRRPNPSPRLGGSGAHPRGRGHGAIVARHVKQTLWCSHPGSE